MGSFCVLAVMDNVAVDIAVQASVATFSLLLGIHWQWDYWVIR